ncbi:MAG: twin-arginine translocation signal domain-containing protein, partial [Candidatus Nanopelagicales bacterium]
MTISRRGFLLAGSALGVAVVAGGYALVEQDVLPGRIPLNTMLGACGDPPPVPDVVPGALETGSFSSKARAGTKVSWTIAYPPGLVDEINIPVCVALHGRGASNSWPFDALSLQFFLADAVL